MQVLLQTAKQRQTLKFYKGSLKNHLHHRYNLQMNPFFSSPFWIWWCAAKLTQMAAHAPTYPNYDTFQQST